MTPKIKIFENVFLHSSTGHRITFRGKIWWKWPLRSCRKIVWITTKKNSGSAGLVPAAILAKIGRLRPKFRERSHPLTCPRIPNLVRIGCVLPDLFRKDWFFGPKSKYNIGFQPTIMPLEIKLYVTLKTRLKKCKLPHLTGSHNGNGRDVTVMGSWQTVW